MEETRPPHLVCCSFGELGTPRHHVRLDGMPYDAHDITSANRLSPHLIQPQELSCTSRAAGKVQCRYRDAERLLGNVGHSASPPTHFLNKSVMWGRKGRESC